MRRVRSDLGEDVAETTDRRDVLLADEPHDRGTHFEGGSRHWRRTRWSDRKFEGDTCHGFPLVSAVQ